MAEDIKFRIEAERLLGGENSNDIIDSYWQVTNTGFAIIAGSSESVHSSIMQYDSQLLFQMTILKCLGLIRLFDGYNYTNPLDGIQYKHTVDPFSMYPIVRCQLEAYCNFSNIYLKHTNEEADILYNLWVLSGLNYRLKYEPEFEENKKKLEKEKELINEIIEKIHNTDFYKNGDEKEKRKVDDAIKNKEWKFIFKGGKIIFQSWKNLFLNSGVKTLIAKDEYMFLSLNSHPSNVSVFQFADMYEKDEHIDSGLHALKLSKMIVGIFIADYCMKYEGAKDTFESLNHQTQALINMINGTFRGNDFYLNNV